MIFRRQQILDFHFFYFLLKCTFVLEALSLQSIAEAEAIVQQDSIEQTPTESRKTSKSNNLRSAQQTPISRAGTIKEGNGIDNFNKVLKHKQK